MIDLNTFEPLHETLQPNTRMCFGCGLENIAGLQIRFFNDGPEGARAVVVLTAKHQGFPGIAHGGIVATMLDEVMGRAALGGNSRRLLYTGKLEIRYRHQVPLETPLLLSGTIDKDRGRIVLTRGSVILPSGKVAAEATATMFEVPAEELNRMDTEEVGWKVYPLNREKS